MLLCRSGRLSAAARDHAFKSPSSFLAQVNARRLRDVTGALRTGTHRCFCASAPGAGPTPAHLSRQQQHRPELLLQLRGWDCGVVPSDWGHLDRVSAVAAGLSERVQSGSGCLDVIGRWSRRHNTSSKEPGGHALFTGTRGVSSARRSTRDMQTRSASTAADKKRDTAGGEETPDREKELNVKEAASSTAQATGDPEPQEGKLNKTQQLKKVFKEYGAVGVSFHIGISLMSLGMFYLLISSGIDMTGLLCKLGFSESVVRSKMAAGTSTFVLAYAVHKLFAPLRISVTLVSVPLIVRYLRKTGLFKPPTPAP